MKKTLLLLCLLGTAMLYAQVPNFIDTLFTIHDTTFVYGSSVDFGGNVDALQMDVSFPTDDSMLPSGRPLMLLIHGGAFMAGTRQDPSIAAMRRDFAKRGYVTASIDYRLGMFQDDSDHNCNITWVFGVEWNCLNLTDTLEWTRGYYRGIQDAHGAIRYLVNHAADYNIDPRNIFVVGESAGAFIALGTGFMDDAAEKPAGVGNISAAPMPYSRFDADCVQRYGWDSNLASLDLNRPDLGSYEGTMHYPAATNYRIRGVGSFYGGIFDDLFGINEADSTVPCLYMFHRSNDMVVPFNRVRLFQEYQDCAFNWPFSCGYIVNRPFVGGSNYIKSLIDAHAALGDSVPDYLAEFAISTVQCDLNSHSIDNYTSRTHNMAVFFAPKIDRSVGIHAPIAQFPVRIHPNPSSGQFQVVLPLDISAHAISLLDLTGRKVYETAVSGHEFTLVLPSSLTHGIYIAVIHTVEGRVARRILLEE
jgi:acetyl esterase/lipase